MRELSLTDTLDLLTEKLSRDACTTVGGHLLTVTSRTHNGGVTV